MVAGRQVAGFSQLVYGPDSSHRANHRCDVALRSKTVIDCFLEGVL
jgi:hypothetical protein